MNSTAEKILKLKKEKDAIILAHYYQPLDIQGVADHVADSFALAKLAQDVDSSVIILCGVKFMAESAKLLNPGKTVYLPKQDAGCPMADMITAENVKELRAKYPDAAVMCYVNSSAAVKAESDVCCTSSSALEIAASLSQKRIIFIPDKNLGAYIAKMLPEKEVILYEGCCPIHDELTRADVEKAQNEHPEAVFIAHPECRPEVLDLAAYIGSTAGLLEYVRKSDKREFIIGTEIGVVEILREEFPDKGIYTARENFLCEDMKKISLEDVLACLEGKCPATELPEEEEKNARQALMRMINYNK